MLCPNCKSYMKSDADRCDLCGAANPMPDLLRGGNAEAAPAASGESRPAPASRQVRDLAGRAPSDGEKPAHRWMLVMALLYAVSALAAVALLLRGGGGGEHESAFKVPRHLLSLPKEGVVGWVSIHGPIYESASGNVWDRGAERWGRRISTLAEKNEVKAIVLDIDSPGGSVGAVQELYDTIRRVRQEKKKPVVAVVGDVAASGGYYLAAGCDKIVAHPGSLVGSIGVIFESMNVQQLFAKIGIKSEPIKSGKLKDIGSPTRPMTAEEKQLLQGIIDDTYGQFLSAVAQGRGLPENAVRPMADGRVFNGRQALGLKLVDALGDSQDAVNLAAKLGGISGKPKVVRDADSMETVLSLLDSKLEGLRPPESEVWRDIRNMMRSGLEYRWTGFQ